MSTCIYNLYFILLLLIHHASSLSALCKEQVYYNFKILKIK